MRSLVVRMLIIFSCSLFRLPTVLEGGNIFHPGAGKEPQPTETEPPTTSTKIEPSTAATSIHAAKLNEGANYFQEIPSVASNTVLKTHTNMSRVQCVLKCKQNKECVDVSFKDDKVCLLLGRALDGAQHRTKIISTVKFPGISSFLIFQFCIS